MTLCGVEAAQGEAVLQTPVAPILTDILFLLLLLAVVSEEQLQGPQ